MWNSPEQYSNISALFSLISLENQSRLSLLISTQFFQNLQRFLWKISLQPFWNKWCSSYDNFAIPVKKMLHILYKLPSKYLHNSSGIVISMKDIFLDISKCQKNIITNSLNTIIILLDFWKNSLRSFFPFQYLEVTFNKPQTLTVESEHCSDKSLRNIKLSPQTHSKFWLIHQDLRSLLSCEILTCKEIVSFWIKSFLQLYSHISYLRPRLYNSLQTWGLNQLKSKTTEQLLRGIST